MKNRIKNKLRSQRGASITFALLLFVVCAVLCSVVLAAATSAAGRLRRIAEVDQRYYAVTSAAELLIDAFEKTPSVSVVKVVETEFTTTYTDGRAGEPEKGTQEETIHTEIGTDKRDLENIQTIQEDVAKNVYLETGTYEKTLSMAASGYNSLSVTVVEKVDGDGNITLTLYNTNNAKGSPSAVGERYTMELTFGVNKSVNKSSKSQNISTTPINAQSYRVTGIMTETTTTALKWKLTGIKTLTQEESNGG